MNLAENITLIENRIKKACEKAHRSPDEITLIGVSKTRPVDLINASIDLGIQNIGENKVQEIREKYEAIEPGVQWHMIGHLQTNKVKYVIDKVDLYHSVDRINLAKELSKRAQKADKDVEVLIQVNVAKEVQKSGIYVEDLRGLVDEILLLPNIKIMGLMNIAPIAKSPEKVRDNFKSMKRLFDAIAVEYEGRLEMKYLSMGMSHDFEVAIEEGANMVRVGTAIYGQRAYI